ncbi:hypothetical protein GCM10027570_11570 [Streptomonospora sediminis]
MNPRSDWHELRDSRMAEHGALEAYEAARFEWVARYEDLIDGAEIDRVQDDIRAGRDEFVAFRMEDYE